MTQKMIPNFEKKIYEKLDFTNEICKILLKYNNDGLEHPYFKLNEVKAMIKTINYSYHYSGENSHVLILKKHKEFTFEFIVNVKNNFVYPALIILNHNEFFGPKEPKMYSLLNHLPYDENLLNPNFNINTLEDLKKYIMDFIELCNKFIDEYIKEIETGNIIV